MLYRLYITNLAFLYCALHLLCYILYSLEYLLIYIHTHLMHYVLYAKCYINKILYSKNYLLYATYFMHIIYYILFCSILFHSIILDHNASNCFDSILVKSFPYCTTFFFYILYYITLYCVVLHHISCYTGFFIAAQQPAYSTARFSSLSRFLALLEAKSDPCRGPEDTIWWLQASTRRQGASGPCLCCLCSFRGPSVCLCHGPCHDPCPWRISTRVSGAHLQTETGEPSWFTTIVPAHLWTFAELKMLAQDPTTARGSV